MHRETCYEDILLSNRINVAFIIFPIEKSIGANRPTSSVDSDFWTLHESQSHDTLTFYLITSQFPSLPIMCKPQFPLTGSTLGRGIVI